MATYTEWWECHHCGSLGSVTFDTRPGDGVPPMYGYCLRCGYTFGCGEDEDFTHPDSYGYLKPLHEINSERYYELVVVGEQDMDSMQGIYTKDEYLRIIEDAGLKEMILNPLNVRFPPMTEDEFFSDEWCRLKIRDPKRWCAYCKTKGPLYQSPFMNWKRNPFEVK
jgi:hypothetical protein